MYQYLSILLVVLGLAFIVSPQFLMLDPNSENTYVKSLYEYRQYLGGALLVGGVYTNLQASATAASDANLSTVSSDLPTYEQATSE